MIKRILKRIFSFGMITWVAIVALGAGLAWQIFFNDRFESKKITALTEKSETQAQALQQIGGILTTYDHQFQQIADHSNQIVTSVKELDAIVRGDSRTWRLMQVQNFLEMAMVQASLLNDTTSAINLLVAADNSLKQIDNPNLIPVRKAIQSDITMLAHHPISNMSNLILALNNVVEQIPTLPHKIHLHKETPVEAPKEETPTKPTWASRLSTAWQEFKSLIRIRHYDEPVTPYFSQDDVWLINENLSLILQQASFAVMHHQERLYQQQLTQAQSWIKQYFDVTDPAVLAVQKALDELAKQSVASDESLHLQTADAWGKFVTSSQTGGK